jgi:hypothetical protein
VQTVSFEWINVGDEDSRRKVRSHVIRESKQRQRVEALRIQKIKESSSRPLASANLRDTLVQQSRDENIATLHTVSKALWTLPRTVLEGAMDPFNRLPVNLNSTRDHGLVDHCTSTTSITTPSNDIPNQLTCLLLQILQCLSPSHSFYQIATMPHLGN